MRNIDELFSTLLLEASRFYDNREYNKALSKINEALSLKKDDVQARNLKAAILIESWDGDFDTKSSIYEAKNHIEICIEKDPVNKALYLGNLGNLFYKIATNDFAIKGTLNKEIVDDFEKAKKCYNESLDIYENQPELWINKGNTLDHLGRYFEALYCYDRAILLDSERYNAWGSRGICCWRLSMIVDNEEDRKILFSNAIKFLAIELKNNPSYEIDESYKKYINDIIHKNKIQVDLKTTLKEQLSKKNKIIEDHFNLFSKCDSGFEEFYLDFCEKHNLFLNTHFDCNDCGHSTLDLINVFFITDINDYENPYEFFKRWCSLIDDYNTSRFYLSLSQYNHSDFTFLNKLRYESDYSLNYLPNVEMLKTAFLLALNIYDKVAMFLNHYEDLGLDDAKVSFWASNSIFSKTKILEKNNWDINLVALYTTVTDLEKEELSILPNIRNYIVHRYFVLHDIIDVNKLVYPYSNPQISLHNSQYHLDIHMFYKLTIHALRQLKGILYSVSFFIAKKEKEKADHIEGQIGKMEWVHNWNENDELTQAAKELENKLIDAYDKTEKELLKAIDDIYKNEKH